MRDLMLLRWARKWIHEVAMWFFRFLTGYVTDVVFQWCNAFGGKPKTLPPVKNPLLLDTAMGLARKIRNREVTSVEVMRAYIDRIESVQPILNAVVDRRYKEAMEEAAQADWMVLNGGKSEAELESETPLLGVPFSVKEAISVSGMLYSAGVANRRSIRGEEDADVVDRLIKAGAIPVVVTNTSEQCFWMEAYNAVYGRTNNPYNPKKTAGGSSGGEGALLAAAGSVIGVGNDVGGSIRIPSAFNGVFGHKPSRGIVPNRGHFPPTEPVLQQYIGTGPMCRYATDLLPLMEVMAGPNAVYLQLKKEVELKNLKVFYMEDDGGSFTLPSKPAVKQAVRKVVEHFRRICEVPPQKVNVRGLKHGFKIWAYALSAVVANVTRLETRVFGENNDTNLFKELFLWFLGMSEHTFPIIITVIVEKYFGPKHKSEGEPFFRIQKNLERDFQNLLKEDCVFIMPTLPEPATYHYANTVRSQNCGYVGVFNILGLPATNCPLGLDGDGMPVGVQIVSGLRNDHLNFAVAREIERFFGGWISPGPIV